MDYIISPGIGMQKKAAANKANFFKVFEDFITGKIKLGENVNVKKLNPDLRTASLALQTLAANSGIMSRSSLRELLVQHPWYKKNQNIWKYATKVLSGDFKGKTFSDLQNFAEDLWGAGMDSAGLGAVKNTIYAGKAVLDKDPVGIVTNTAAVIPELKIVNDTPLLKTKLTHKVNQLPMAM